MKETKADIARSYIDTHKEVKHDKTLARMMHKELPGIFKTIDAARTHIRLVKGKSGDAQRQRAPIKTHFEPLHHNTTPPKNPQKALTDAKILLLDIETAPISAYVWSLWKQNVYTDQIREDWFMLTWSAKWLFDKKVMCDRLTGDEALRQDDSRITRSIWALIDEADITISHNGDKFDLPKLNTRFLKHGLNPPSPYQSIDTLKTLRRSFGFSSNKLDHVNRILSLRRKIDTGGFGLWADCYKGDEAALKKMEKYNIHDVRILEDTYLALRPWIKPHPSVNLFLIDGEHRCPSCGSNDLTEGGTYKTYANEYSVLRCNDCGGLGRKVKSNLTVTQRSKMLYSIPK